MNRDVLELGGIRIEVTRKNIRNINIRVYPSGEVKISAPLRVSLTAVRSFALSKRDWISRQQQNASNSRRASSTEYVDNEKQCVWGKRYMLKVIEREGSPDVRLESDILLLSVTPGTGREKKQAIVSAWYKEQLKNTIQFLYDKWKHVIGVDVEKFSLRQMRTRWGSCSPRSRRIRINTELAKRPVECLEYVMVHEMVHILEPSHNQRFRELMGTFMPEWRCRRNELKLFSNSV